jgi:demethylmenaquinone methyltransferase/2-methoxy-6-polyprenyl-1,4-benzoquinol methylase/phosphoethanolamine N-methyltransferase
MMRDHLHNATRGHVIHWAPLYDLAFGRFLRRTHAAVVELAAVRSGERVLDVGCGTGSLAVALKASAGPRGSVLGVDASKEMIDVARRNVTKAGVDVSVQVGLAEALPFPDETFDLVVSQLAIHHLPGDLKRAAFTEMRRVLKSGGRCLIIDFEPPRSFPGRLVARLVVGPEMMQVHVAGYRAPLEQAGFSGIETGRTRHRLLSFVRCARGGSHA